ncbi:DUF4276 family protein [Hydrogenophaga sp.]|uniref:DUF4276 family protein n=1 Tax=Hydrogenophaga sp. TaxID=1904254 RepID=UPI0019874727|nr:DUF4276 family protein [Hydrogenophaga sp.]MBD3893398.1 DUF4276 family protein [Hydrogenophaga sp.]
MAVIASIVEGDGEVAALPVLLRRLGAECQPQVNVMALPPIRVRRDRFLNKEEEFKRQLLLAAAKCGDGGWILLVLDADDDCPATLSKNILHRAQQYIPHRKFSVVLANREFEAWFVASAASLNGVRGFVFRAELPTDVERPRDAKGWLQRQMTGAYSEKLDQPAFSARFDMQQAWHRSRSFRKLCKEWHTQMGGLFPD